MTGPVNFQANATQAYGLMGYLSGITKSVQTSAYINAVLSYTHATLAEHLNMWIDGLARARPNEFMHVYRWPRTFGHYGETVGNPMDRLWRNTLTGRGRSKVASFKFLAETRPTPVDPLLLKPGKSGRSVKSGVHVFVLKAQAMEYGIDITVSPKLAKMLAYIGRDTTSGGHDAGQPHTNADGVRFSQGPVTFKAGGGITTGKFTGAFLAWWKEQAGDIFDKKIAPVLETELVNRAAMNSAIRLGSTQTKGFTIAAGAAQNTRTFAEAEALAIRKMGESQANYLAQAEARRSLIYGE